MRWLVSYPSANNIPQPSTYYTDLLQIKNVENANRTIKSITVSDLKDASNLKCLTVFLFTNQTDNPTASTPLGAVFLTNSSKGDALLSGKFTLEPSEVNYIEVAGCAVYGSYSSTVQFKVNLQP